MPTQKRPRDASEAPPSPQKAEPQTKKQTKKPKAASAKTATTPKTLKAPSTGLAKCVAAIRELKKAGGSSSQAILKVCKQRWAYDNAAAIRKALKAGVAKGVLVQTKASFAVAGEEYEDTSAKVEWQDLKTGSGGAVERGHTIVIAYAGKLANGDPFDKASSFAFTVGGGEVVKGMDAAVLGMRVGGKRQARIPASLGYGKRGSPPEIPGDAELIFDITLKKFE